MIEGCFRYGVAALLGITEEDIAAKLQDATAGRKHAAAAAVSEEEEEEEEEEERQGAPPWLGLQRHF